MKILSANACLVFVLDKSVDLRNALSRAFAKIFSCEISLYTVKAVFINLSLYVSGPSLSVTRLHILSFSEAFTRPWALTLISVTPASLRMEPGDVKDNRLSSILLNVGGRVLMVQRELPRPQVSQDKQRVHHCVG